MTVFIFYSFWWVTTLKNAVLFSQKNRSAKAFSHLTIRFLLKNNKTINHGVRAVRVVSLDYSRVGRVRLPPDRKQQVVATAVDSPELGGWIALRFGETLIGQIDVLRSQESDGIIHQRSIMTRITVVNTQYLSLR